MRWTRQIPISFAAFSFWLSSGTAHRSDGGPELPSCSITTMALPQLFPDLLSERIKVNYGPFTVPSRLEHHGMRSFQCAPPPPCKDCMIVWMQAGLEYTDGSNANADTGMWLHHTVWQNLKRKDPMCRTKKGERFFASGNERTPIDLTSNGLKKLGYRLKSEDHVAFHFEAMNMEVEERDVVLTVTWEYIPSMPKTFKEVQPYWFDVGGCGSSSMPAKADSVFEYSSTAVKAPTSGVVAMVAGHLHDGGTHLEVMRQDEPFCVTRAIYENGHINQMTTCESLSYSKGEQFSIIAHYDTGKHTPMAHPDGELEPVMGISLIYTVEDGAAKRHKKHLGRNIAFAIFFTAALATISGFIWFRFKNGKGSSRALLPAWLRPYYTKNQPNALRNAHSLHDGYQTLPAGEDGEEYRD